MFCGECGTQNPDTNQFCRNCGKPLKKPQQAAVLATQYQAPAQTAGYQPAPAVVQQQASYQQQPAYPSPATPTVKQPWSTGKKVAVISIVSGIAAFILAPLILFIVALLLGAYALWKREKLGIAGIVVGGAAFCIHLFYPVIFP